MFILLVAANLNVIFVTPRKHFIVHSTLFLAIMPFPIGGPLEPNLTVSEIFNVKCNAPVDVTLIRPLNKGQGHSFWYQSISHIRLSIGSQ